MVHALFSVETKMLLHLAKITLSISLFPKSGFSITTKGEEASLWLFDRSHIAVNENPDLKLRMGVITDNFSTELYLRW